jgi:hypothetical protein
MAKPSISIGVDDATGRPANAPEGPYITDEDDGTRPRKPKRSRADPGPARDKSRDPRGHDPPTDKDFAGRRKGPTQP